MDRPTRRVRPAEPGAGFRAAASVGKQDLPPIQEAEAIEEDRPFYKKWWFWALVLVVVAGVFVEATVNDGVNDSPNP